jgi:hypothetical protein
MLTIFRASMRTLLELKLILRIGVMTLCPKNNFKTEIYCETLKLFDCLSLLRRGLQAGSFKPMMRVVTVLHLGGKPSFSLSTSSIVREGFILLLVVMVMLLN